jgi:hypothetical protein
MIYGLGWVDASVDSQARGEVNVGKQLLDT